MDLFNRCLIENVLPTGDDVIADGPRTTGVKNYKEFFQALVGLSGESSNFDGNGPYTRFQPGGGADVVQTAAGGARPLFGNATRPPLGTRPARPAKRPPYNRTEPCSHPAAPQSRWRPHGRWTVKKAIERPPARLRGAAVPVRHRRSAVGGYILSNQRFNPPAWVPVWARTSTSSRPSCPRRRRWFRVRARP